MSAPRVSSHTPGTAVARSSSGRAPGMWAATSARGSAFGVGAGVGCAGSPAAPHSASNNSNLLAIMNDFRLLVGGLDHHCSARFGFGAAQDAQFSTRAADT